MFTRITAGVDALPSSLRTQRLVRERLAQTGDRLSSGIRLTSASVDPSGVVASDFLRSRVRSLEQASENLQFGSNLITTAESALDSISGLLVRLRELSVNAANLTGSKEQTDVLQDEADAIVAAISRITETTRAGRVHLFNGGFQRTATVVPASSTGNLGAVAAFVPDFSTIGFGRHQLEIRNAGGAVTAVDTATLLGPGEFGQVTDGGVTPGFTPFLTTGANQPARSFVFQNGVDSFFAQGGGGLDENPPFTPIAAGAAAMLDVQLSPTQGSILYEAANGANRGIFSASLAGGAPVLLGEGLNDFDYDVTSPQLASQQLTYVSESNFLVTPSIDDVSGMAFARIAGVDSVFVADDNAGAGGGPGLQRFDVLGRPIGGVVDLTPIFGVGGTVDGLAYNSGTGRFFAVSASNLMVYEFTAAGALTSSFAVNNLVGGEVFAGAYTSQAVPGSSFVTAIPPGAPTVTAPAGVLVPEDLIVTFNEDTGAGISIDVNGTETGNQGLGLAFPTSADNTYTINGVSFTLRAENHASRSAGAILGAATNATDRLDVRIDGGARTTIELIASGDAEFPAGSLNGAALAARIESRINGEFGAGTVTARFDGASSRVVIQRSTVGGTVEILTPDFASRSATGVSAFVLDDNNDRLDVDVDGVRRSIELIEPVDGGAPVGVPALVARLQTKIDTAFGAGLVNVRHDATTDRLVLERIGAGTVRVFDAEQADRSAAGFAASVINDEFPPSGSLDVGTDRLDIRLNGVRRTIDLVPGDGGGSITGAGPLTAAIQTGVDAAFGAGRISVTYDAVNDRAILQGTVLGDNVQVFAADGPSVSGLLSDAAFPFGTEIVDGVNDVLTFTFNGVATSIDLIQGGDPEAGLGAGFGLQGVAAIAARIQTKLDANGLVGAGNTRVDFDPGAVPVGDERIFIRSETTDGAATDASFVVTGGSANATLGFAASPADSAFTVLGFGAGGDQGTDNAADNLGLGLANGGEEGIDDGAPNLLLGVANGGFEAVGAAVLNGDTFRIDVTQAGVTPAGLALDLTGAAFGAGFPQILIGDSTSGFIHRYNLAGVQQDGGLDVGSVAGFGALSRIEVDPSTGGLLALDAAGNLLEIDDSPAAGPNNITAVDRGAPGPVATGQRNAIALFDNTSFQAGARNLFLGDDATRTIRQFARTAPGAYADTGNNVYRQDLGTLALNQVSGEAGNEIDPHLSQNGTRIAYVAAGGDRLVVRDLNGVVVNDQSGLTGLLGAAITAIDSVSVDGRFVSVTTGGGSFVLDAAVPGTSFATGANQQFSQTANRQLFFFDGANIQRMDPQTGATLLVAPAATADFDVSPDGTLIAYRDAVGDVRTVSTAGGATTLLTNLAIPGGDLLVTGSNVRFSEDSAEVVMIGPGSDVFIRNANGTTIPVLPPGGAFATGPSATAANSLVRETFTLTLITDNDGTDAGGPPGGDVFSVTGSISGAQGTASVGTLYTSPGNFLGVGAGLQFTIAPSGQYAPGTTFTIDTDFVFGTKIDGGPEFITPTGQSEVGFTPDGGSLGIEFGTVALPPGAVIFQEILVEPGAVLQAKSELTKDDELPFYIEAISASRLDLVPFDVTDFLARVSQTELRSGGLTLLGPPAIADPNASTPAETIKIVFTSPTLFNVTGSVSGPIAEDLVFAAGTPFTVGNVTLTLGGVGSTGDEVRIDVAGSAQRVDQAIDRVNRLRSVLGSTAREAQAMSRTNAVDILEMLDSVSEIRDADIALEAANFTRDQVFLEALVGLQNQVDLTREMVLDVLRDNASADELFGGI